MHCWHQKVTVTPARSGDSYGDIQVDPARAYEVYKEWMAMTRPQTDRPDGLRRPLWMISPVSSSEQRLQTGTEQNHLIIEIAWRPQGSPLQ